jgi:hypothetical protein
MNKLVRIDTSFSIDAWHGTDTYLLCKYYHAAVPLGMPVGTTAGGHCPSLGTAEKSNEVLVQQHYLQYVR